MVLQGLGEPTDIDFLNLLFVVCIQVCNLSTLCHKFLRESQSLHTTVVKTTLRDKKKAD
jgi:hypothetical protein